MALQNRLEQYNFAGFSTVLFGIIPSATETCVAQRRWCAIHDLKLFYFENPRVCVLFAHSEIFNDCWFLKVAPTVQSEEANGFVNLRGAIVTESKRLPLAFEIQTGALFSERGMEKRVFTFTPVGAGAICVS